MEIRVEHPTDAASVLHLTPAPGDGSIELADALALGANAGTGMSMWLHGTTDDLAEVMRSAGLISDRTLLQMRAPLPVAAPTIETSPFTRADLDEFVAVNNRAFDWHPEQSGLTPARVEADMAAPWFDADGFRLHRVDGALAGFCWTKIHPATDTDPALGEIYVIAVDPPFHGRGLGTQLTLAGLEWLADRGLDTAMLYVESDNTAAVATYEKIGFVVHRRDTMWGRP